MPHKQSLIVEIDTMLSAASVSRRTTILRQITDLFIEGAASYSEEQIAIFDLVLKILTENVERMALVELSGRLASTDNAPADLVNRLSWDDDIAVAGSILEKSSALIDSDLVEIAKVKGQNHLLAIAGRTRINAPITDVLIGRGLPDVTRKIVTNDGACFSETAFVKLINEAKRDENLAAMIATRKDIPAELRPFLQLVLA
jgi:uncharacterized protein (DUF2336 family)